LGLGSFLQKQNLVFGFENQITVPHLNKTWHPVMGLIFYGNKNQVLNTKNETQFQFGSY
jgi:hypothetical protein